MSDTGPAVVEVIEWSGGADGQFVVDERFVEWRSSYVPELDEDDRECPDCGTLIPRDLVVGGDCPGCGRGHAERAALAGDLS